MFEKLVETYDLLQEYGVESPLLEVLRLFDLLSIGALRKADTSLLVKTDLRHLAEERKAGKPLEYILGRATFCGLDLLVTPDTLIPRAETKLLVQVALGLLDGQLQATVVDMATGCGNVAVALATSDDRLTVLASDLCPAAVEVAQSNIARYGLQERVRVLCGDLFTPLRGLGYEGAVDIVVCNPPYVPTSSLDKLPTECIDHEPVVAMEAGAYGLDIVRRLIRDSLPMLKPGGALAFEIGAGQEKLVTRLLERTPGYGAVRYHNDGETVRVISAVKQPTT